VFFVSFLLKKSIELENNNANLGLLTLVPSDLNTNIYFDDQVCVEIFCNKPKGITTEGTEALRATQSKYFYRQPFSITEDEIRS